MSVRVTQAELLVSSANPSHVRVTQAELLVSSANPSHVRVTQAALLISASYSPMGITYPLTPPVISGIGPQDFTMSGVSVVGETESPFSLNQQMQQWPGQRWEIDANLPPMLYQQAEQWIAFLAALGGKYGTFLMGDYNRPTPQGPMTGSPITSGSNPAGANQITIQGATASIANWAVGGDYLQVQYLGNPKRIYKILENVSSDSGGNVTAPIFPNLHEALGASTPIFTTNCVGTFRLKDNTFKWSVDKNKIYKISFKAKEAL